MVDKDADGCHGWDLPARCYDTEFLWKDAFLASQLGRVRNELNMLTLSTKMSSVASRSLEDSVASPLCTAQAYLAANCFEIEYVIKWDVLQCSERRRQILWMLSGNCYNRRLQSRDPSIHILVPVWRKANFNFTPYNLSYI